MSASLVLFRADLRLTDNPALAAALARGGPVLGLYVHETDPGLRWPGGAVHWWLHHSLARLAGDLETLGVPLRIETGELAAVIADLTAAYEIGAVFWNRRYGPAERAVDSRLKSALKDRGLSVESFNAGLLVEPFAIASKAGTPFAVFTPFNKALRTHDIPRPLKRPAPAAGVAPEGFARADAYRAPRWAAKLDPLWTPGEAKAAAALDRFVDDRLADYARLRDVPGTAATSALSPHLRFGEIGPRQIWHRVQAKAAAEPELAAAAEKFLAELAWRDFSHNLLFHHADIASEPMQARYADFPWRSDPSALAAWQAGQTGIPIVDAGMRQLWQTGWMHNRVRMLVASYLAKNLLIDWREGEKWFWDTLVDADPANNPASWQWVAGCGADAAPYFRIFNPVLQGEKFDPDGGFVRRFVPELADLPDAFIHRPFEAPAAVLKKAGLVLGETYPRPLADPKASRARALAVFDTFKQEHSG